MSVYSRIIEFVCLRTVSANIHVSQSGHFKAKPLEDSEFLLSLATTLYLEDSMFHRKEVQIMLKSDKTRIDFHYLARSTKEHVFLERHLFVKTRCKSVV